MEELFGNLVEKARDGDIESFSQLYREVYKDLYRFALYALRNEQDAQDVVSDTVADAFSQMSTLRTPEAFRGWIFKILSNKCRSRLKDYIQKPLPLSENLMLSDSEDLSENANVRHAFAKLSEEERLILSLKVFGGYTSKEMGKILEMNDSTVRSKQKRALKKLEFLLRA